MVTIRGGANFEKAMKDMAAKLKKSGKVKVGFLEGAMYPKQPKAATRKAYKDKKKNRDTTPVAGSTDVDATTVPMVAAIQNFGAPDKGIPPRPFFSNMVKDKSPGWAPAMAKLLKNNDYDTTRTLAQMGEGIAGDLRQAIVDTNDPPLSEKTIKAKGFDKPLVDTGHMLNSVDYEVND